MVLDAASVPVKFKTYKDSIHKQNTQFSSSSGSILAKYTISNENYYHQWSCSNPKQGFTSSF